MAFTLDAKLTGVFPVSNGAGPTGQGIAISAQAINTILHGLNPDGSPAASIAPQQPQPQSPPITRTPFTLAGIVSSIRNNPIPSLAVAAVLGWLVWKGVK